MVFIKRGITFIMSNAPSKTFFCSLRSWLMYKTLTIHFINLALNLRV